MKQQPSLSPILLSIATQAYSLPRLFPSLFHKTRLTKRETNITKQASSRVIAFAHPTLSCTRLFQSRIPSGAVPIPSAYPKGLSEREQDKLQYAEHTEKNQRLPTYSALLRPGFSFPPGDVWIQRACSDFFV